MKRVLITGVSGYIGGRLAATLNTAEDVTSIIGTDIVAPPKTISRLTFIKHDVREPMAGLLRENEVDTVVHAAYVLPPKHDTGLMEDINVRGTLTVLRSCADASVPRILYTSSATAYGFHQDNPVPLIEESPLRGNINFTYAKNKKEIEAIFTDFAAKHPEIGITILRPCFVVGPGFDNPLSNHLKKPVVMFPSKSHALQFVHEDDLIRAMILCIKKDIRGVFNIAGSGSITVREMVNIMGKIPLPVPIKILWPLNTIAWHLRLGFLTRFPSPALNLFRYSWLASPQKFIEETGFTYEYDTLSAFKHFARHAG